MILYFSGTGNSEYIARRIAKATGDEILSLTERIRNGNAAAVRTERLVFVTPTYGWRIPRLVEKWIDETEFYGDELSAWFIMSCGSEIGNAAKYNARLCERKGFAYMGTEQVIMPENYVAMFAVPERDEAIKIVAARTGQIADAAERIANGEPFTAEPVKLIDRISVIGSRIAISDAGVGITMCEAAMKGASLNVFINTKLMKDRELAEDMNFKADKMLAEAAQIEEETFGRVMDAVRP